MAEKPPDWQCPTPSCINHLKMVFGTKIACPKCGANRDDPVVQVEAEGGIRPEKGMQGGDMPHDWQCPNEQCKNNTKMVFGKHLSCPACGTARNAAKPGDWLCPNVSCQNHKNTVFASKIQCPRCGTPRPGTGMALPQMRMMGPQVMGGRAGQAQMPQVIIAQPGPGGTLQLDLRALTTLLGGAAAGGITLAGAAPNGDWQCPNTLCVNHSKMVFAKNQTCPKCGSAKAAAAAAPQMVSIAPMGMKMAGVMGGMVGKGGRGPQPGDWKCPNAECVNHKNHVFAKHTSCPSCGSEKPAGGGHAVDRSRSPGPFRLHGTAGMGMMGMGGMGMMGMGM